MPDINKLTETEIKRFLSNSNYNKGRGYINQVRNMVRQGNTLLANVQGSRLYQVEIDIEPENIHFYCSCPVGGACKHIAAVLLKWIHSPGLFAAQEKIKPPANQPLEVIPVEPPASKQPKELPGWVAFPMAERHKITQKYLENWLNYYRVQDLREIAKTRKWALKGTAKAVIIQQLIEYMTHPGELIKGITSLDEEHKWVWWATVLLGGEAYREEKILDHVTKQFGLLKKHKQAATYLAHLCDMGLAINGSVTYDYGRYSSFVPAAFLRQLPPVLEEFIPTNSADPATEIRLADPHHLVRAANQLILLLESNSTPLRPPMPRPRLEKFVGNLAGWDYDPQEIARLNAEGKFKGYQPDMSVTIPPPPSPLPDAAIQQLAPLAGSNTRLEFMYHLLVQAGLFQPGSPITVWQAMKDQFLRLNEGEQRGVLIRTYFELQTWSELWLLLHSQPDLCLQRSWVYGHINPVGLYEELKVVRQRVLRVLACLPNNRWIPFTKVAELLRPLWPRFEMGLRNYYYYPNSKIPAPLFLTQNGRILNHTSSQDWNIAQGVFIQHLITGPLHWLGLADVRLNEGQLSAFRLHGLNDLFWDKKEALEAPDDVAPTVSPKSVEKGISINDNDIIVNPSAVTAHAHNYLDNIARLTETGIGRFVYRLDATAVHTTFEHGTALGDLADNWQKYLGLPMPAHIREQLTTWWQSYGQVRIYQEITAIEFGDDYALTEMKAVTSLEKVLIAEISPRLVLIPETAVATLTAELEKAGYTPKQTDQV